MKTLQVVTDTWALVENGTSVGRRLSFRVNFVYDSPNFYREIKSVDKNGTLGSSVVSAFDGRYYYSQSLFRDEKVIVRRKEPNPNGNPYVTAIPLLALFAFAFNGDDSKDFESLKSSKVWESFAQRINHVESKQDNSLVLNSCIIVSFHRIKIEGWIG